MALSDKQRRILRNALADKNAADAIADAIDAAGNSSAEAVEDLEMTVSDPPEQSEVQAIADKVDELMAALRAAGLMQE